MSDVLTRIVAIVASHCPPTVEVKATSELRADLHFDCIDRMSIAAEIEDEFEFLISDDALEAAETVGDLVASVEAALLEKVDV